MSTKTDEELDEELRKVRLYAKDGAEMYTEYPFFYDGMMSGEFEAEQRAYGKFLSIGGHAFEYVPLIYQTAKSAGRTKAVPFWREDMQPGEYDQERAYLIEHWDDYKRGKYTPLWKQKL